MKNIKDRGITLIALVITIIILLILAGITIFQLKESGLFEKAKNAKEISEESKLKEEIEMAILNIQTKELANGNNVTLQSLANQLKNELKQIIVNKVNDNEIIGNYKDYDYTIDNNLNVKVSFTTNLEIEKNVRYILFEVNGHHQGGDCASLAEIQIKDKQDRNIEYSIITDNVYDSVVKHEPEYWNFVNFWGYDNLYDGSIEYPDTWNAKENCCIFMYYSTDDANNEFSRFVVDLNDKRDIEDINVCLGDTDGRMPKSISAYIINNYSSDTYANNIAQRNNEGLTLINTIEFENIVTTPTWYNFIK